MPEEVQHTEVAAPAAPEPAAAPATEPEATEAAASPDGQQNEQQTDPKTDPEERPRDERGRFKGAQARIDELTRARYEAEREAAYWRSLASAPQQQAQQQQPKPTPEQFPDYAQYVEALTEWKAGELLERQLARRDAVQAQTAAQRAAAAREMTFAERTAIVRQAMPDFDEVVGKSEIPIAEHVRSVLLDSESGPQLAYHLARNPDLAQRISAMDPLTSARELGRLEASLAARPAAARTVSNAPPPARGIPGNASSPSRDPTRMSMDEYVAWRRSQKASWAR